MKRRRIIIEGEQAVRLEELARRWGTTPTEALRRALDQAFVGRGAMVALQAGLIFLENMEFKKPTELKPKEKPDPQIVRWCCRCRIRCCSTWARNVR